MNVFVCLCVCLSAIISQELQCTRPIFANFFVNGRGSIFIWRRSDTLRISGLLMTSYLT